MSVESFHLLACSSSHLLPTLAHACPLSPPIPDRLGMLSCHMQGINRVRGVAFFSSLPPYWSSPICPVNIHVASQSSSYGPGEIRCTVIVMLSGCQYSVVTTMMILLVLSMHPLLTTVSLVQKERPCCLWDHGPSADRGWPRRVETFRERVQACRTAESARRRTQRQNSGYHTRAPCPEQSRYHCYCHCWGCLARQIQAACRAWPGKGTTVDKIGPGRLPRRQTCKETSAAVSNNLR